jgi:hypothetical protein
MADGQDGAVATDQRQAVHRLRIDADPESVEKGLVTLVLTLVELLRQLMERQALRRVEQGSLTDDQIEKVGSTLMALEARMAELRDHFGLTVEDLNLDLGPLGPLLPREGRQAQLWLECLANVLAGVFHLLSDLTGAAARTLCLSLGLQVRIASGPASLFLGPPLAHLEPVAHLVEETHVVRLLWVARWCTSQVLAV